MGSLALQSNSCPFDEEQAWNLVIHSSIGLIDELFAAGFNAVLTGRFNLDPLEVM
jgi:hypothetical protein